MSRKSTKSTGFTKNEADLARKLFKNVLDSIKRLEEIFRRKTVIRDVFSAEAIFYRNRLKEQCERLMFYDPLEYGRKGEELLWRRVFYDAIQIMKQSRKSKGATKAEDASLLTHLTAASGYYNHLIYRLQSEYSVQQLTDFSFTSAYTVPGQKEEKDPRVTEWAEAACHRCVIYLGDLARYQKEFFGDSSWLLAQRYYCQAALMCPQNGMPYNQLGTLVGMQYYGLDAAYYYIRSLACTSKFEGASGNLKRIFERNRKRYLEVIKFSVDDHHRGRPLKHFCVKFLHLMDKLYNSTEIEPKALQLLCQSVLQDFNTCLTQSPRRPSTYLDDEEEEKVKHLEEEAIFKIVVLVIMLVHKLRSQASNHVAAAIALCLAIFSHILSLTLMRLQGLFYPDIHTAGTSSRPPNSLDNSPQGQSRRWRGSAERVTPGGLSEEDSDSDAKGDTKSDTAVKRRKALQMQRRRHRRSLDSEDDLSENEEGPQEVLTMISDDEEEIKFLAGGSDSSLGSDDDMANLMDSQELDPGFNHTSTTEEGSAASNHAPTNGENTGGHNSNGHKLQSPKSRSSGFAVSGNTLTLHHLLNQPLSSSFFGNQGDLEKISSDFLSLDMYNTGGMDFDLNGVVQGNKAVSVPPGFDKDPEARHATEISEKLATFVVETDTNSSLLTTTEDERDSDSESGASVIDRTQLQLKSESVVLDKAKLISEEGLMPTIKIMCDWLATHPHIVTMCSHSSPMLWSRAASFLNELPNESVLKSLDCYKHSSVKEAIFATQVGDDTWIQKLPLREDVGLHNVASFRDSHTHLDLRTRPDMTPIEETILRICCLRNFGHKMTTSKFNVFHCDKSKNLFTSAVSGPNQSAQPPQARPAHVNNTATPTHVNNTAKPTYLSSTAASSHLSNTQLGPNLHVAKDTESENDKILDEQHRKDQMMRMAQLRLQAEIDQLEKSVQDQDSHSDLDLPPYLVPDSSSLCEHLDIIRKLVQSKISVLVIATVVIDELDQLKASSLQSREASRWLEGEFRKGNRFIRAQRTGDTVTMDTKIVQSKNRTLYGILGCCAFLAQQSSQDASIVSHSEGTQALAGFLVSSLYPAHILKEASKKGISVHNVRHLKVKAGKLMQEDSK